MSGSGEVITILRSGKFKTGGELRSAVEAVAGPALKKAGLRVVAVEMAASPVVSGHLRRGWAAGEPEWRGNVLIVKIGNAVIYARRVDATSQKNKGFIEEAFEQNKEEIISALKEELKVLAKQLWKKA